MPRRSHKKHLFEHRRAVVTEKGLIVSKYYVKALLRTRMVEKV